ncbi:MAG TPA: type II secretion system minor pseudopilin GspJ [Casimicrobiaceae bacterium]|nr:type II secretion system minor pseudopilin GspJ [Casimicrobiaceae bacterium]
MHARRLRKRGFTLIEILVALVILAVVALLAYRATAAMSDGEARLSAESERWRTLDGFFARIEADMREAVPRGSRHGAAVEPAWWSQTADSAGNSALAFTRAGPEFAIEPGVAGQRIGYRLAGDRIEVIYWPQLDNVDDARASAYPLVAGVRQFRVSQLGAGAAWVPRWPVTGDSPVPRAVRIEITLDDGTSIDREIMLR